MDTPYKKRRPRRHRSHKRWTFSLHSSWAPFLLRSDFRTNQKNSKTSFTPTQQQDGTASFSFRMCLEKCVSAAPERGPKCWHWSVGILGVVGREQQLPYGRVLNGDPRPSHHGFQASLLHHLPPPESSSFSRAPRPSTTRKPLDGNVGRVAMGYWVLSPPRYRHHLVSGCSIFITS